MGVLAGGGNSDGAGPVVVEMSQLVGQLLEVLGGQTGGVLNTTINKGNGKKGVDGLTLTTL